LAAVPDLRTPQRLLILSGPPDCGKTMLAKALARIFAADKGPTTFTSETFSDMMTPIVLFDEELPKHFKYTTGINRLKNQLVENFHHFNPKYKPRELYHGALKFIVTANESSFQEVIGIESLAEQRNVDALEARFLFVEATEEASSLIAGKTAADFTDWVEGGLVARHIMWMHQNLPQPDVDRFGPIPVDQQHFEKAARFQKSVGPHSSDMVKALLYSLTYAVQQNMTEIARFGYRGEEKFLMVSSEKLSLSSPMILNSTPFHKNILTGKQLARYLGKYKRGTGRALDSRVRWTCLPIDDVTAWSRGDIEWKPNTKQFEIKYWDSSNDKYTPLPPITEEE
jgi:energy-coupling factor transporter ATP-binding protein EcfA2